MSVFTDAYAGHHVTVLTSIGGGQEHADTGTLVALNDHWVQLAKDNGERLLFPANSVRVIKLLDVEPGYVPTDQARHLVAPDTVPNPAVYPRPTGDPTL